MKYFFRQKQDKIPIFLKRFPGYDFSYLKVLDLGCGHGALSVELAERGAGKVVGVDLNARRIGFARKNLKNNYPHLEEKVHFVCADVRDIEDTNFDTIVSKATFEHLFHLESLLREK